MKKSYDTFKDVVSNFFKGKEKVLTGSASKVAFNVYDRTVLIKMDATRNAEITLQTNGTADQYEGFRVCVVDKKKGELVRHWFSFKEYMKSCKYVWRDGNEIGWYGNIPHPQDVDSFVKVIADYINAYR